MSHAICYISNATTLLDEIELNKLFETCLVTNKSKKITGILIYKEGTFVQLLEGEKEDIYALFGTICYDSRHNQITKVLDRPIEQNIFRKYSTGFSSFFNDKGLEELNIFIEKNKDSDYGRSVRAFLQPFVLLLA